jgi:Ca-activated chloride channel family protein
MTIEFNNLPAFHWLWLVAAATLLGLIALAWRARAVERLLASAVVARVAPTRSRWRPAIRMTLTLAAMTLLVGALADPRAGSQTEEVRRSGADIMFVVDVSRSMLAEDATPNRLERAKLFMEDAIRELGGDRVGLVDFAGVAALRTPLTLNYGAFAAAVDGLEPKDSLRGGSMLGDAIRVAAASFPSDAIAGKAIVILSDGEDMGSDPVAVAKEVHEAQGIRIVAVGLGDSRDGGRIPIDRGGERTWQLHEGQEVWSKMDQETLRSIAEAGGGLFVGAGTAHVDLGEILLASLADVQRSETETSTIVRTIPRYQFPVALALILLVAEALMTDMRRARTASLGAAS